jgi:hypothetical protein
MKRQLVAGIALLLAFSLTGTVTPAQQPAAKATASVEGVVTRAGTGEPLAGARVTLLPLAAPATPATSLMEREGSFIERVRQGRWPDGPAPSAASAAPAAKGGTVGPPASPIPFVTSDTLGKFAFRNLEAGRYRLWIGANGYVEQEYGQSSNVLRDKHFTLSDGQALGSLKIQLIPTGSIAGRVLSASGGPAVGVRVTLYTKGYLRYGQPLLQDTQSIAHTNDRGEFRIFWITPGRYYVGAGGSARRYSSPSLLNEVVEPFALMFYPNEMTLEAASTVEVRPGAALEGVDFILQPQTFHRIRGRVIDSRTGRPPDGAIILVSARLPSGEHSYNEAYYNAANGTFEVPDVQPGEYAISAQPHDQPLTTAQPPFLGIAAVTVSDADVDNVQLSIAPPDAIAGQILADAPLPRRVEVRLEPAGAYDSRTQTTAAVAAADGSFTLQARRDIPAEYRVVIGGLPPGWYLKEARLGDRDALTQTQLSGAGRLEIMLSSKAGNVSCVIEGAQGRPVPGAKAVLVPDTRARLDLFQMVTAERDGRFAFSSVPPGGYRILAWEDVNFYALFDPAVFKEFEDKATPVWVADSSRETLRIRVIPTGDAQ